MFIRDTNAPRVFLGPVAMFQNPPMMQQQPFHPAGMAQAPQPVAPNLAVQAITPAPQAQAGPQMQAPAAGAGVAVGGVAAGSGVAAASPRANKIPRPCNAWIMYRKDHHATFAATNTGLTNNQICKSFNLKFN
jgi:HMG (high mobility group) box